MVEATGAWHDWEQLRLLGAQLAARRAEMAPLAKALELRTAKALDRAMRTCSRNLPQIRRSR
jgi:hypothetical protein